MQNELENLPANDMVEEKKEESKCKAETQEKLKLLQKESPLSDKYGKLLYRTKPKALQELLDVVHDGVRKHLQEICGKYRVDNDGYRNFKEQYFHLDIPIVILDGIPADIELQRYESRRALQKVAAYAVALYRDFEKEHGRQENPVTDIMVVSTLDYLHTDEFLMELTVMEKLDEGRELRINIVSVNGEMADESTSPGRLMLALMKRNVTPEDFLPEFPLHAQAIRELKEQIGKGDFEVMSEFERIEHQEIEEAVQAAEARGEAKGKARVLGAVAGILIGEEYGFGIPSDIVSEILGALQRLFPEFQMSAAAAARRI